MEQAELRNAGVVEGVIELRLRRKLAEAEHRANVGRHRCRSLQLQLQRVEEVQRSQEHAAACLTMPLETESTAEQTEQGVPVRFHIIRNARIENVGQSQSCMVSKLRIIWKQTVPVQHGSDLRARCHELNQRAAAAGEDLAFTRQRLEDCELELPILRRRCALLQAEQDDEDVSGCVYN